MQLNIKSQASLNHAGLTGLYNCVMSIGARVRQLRQHLDISQDEFGDLCGVSKAMVSHWESDTNIPTTDKLMKLSESVSFSFDWLLKGIGVNPYEITPEAKVWQAMQQMNEYGKNQMVKIGNSLAEPEGNGGDPVTSPPKASSN